MTKLRLSSKLKDIEKPNLKKTRHKISKEDLEKYYEKEGTNDLYDTEQEE